ncbi:MAG: portal protein [Candidatus Melainabacteria bacterium]|nr:MAG: portal protein [Candidatus Melainabacteria bacterium]
MDESPDGNIDTIFSEISMSVRNAVKVYGYENLSAKARKDFDNGDIENNIKILHVIEPRLERDKSKKGVKDMPIASIHIEIETRKILKESGMEEMPVFMGRFSKVPGEIYGRSPAMVAMADILEINAVREAISIATEKQLDPPLALYDDGALGAGTIDTSAGALNVFSVTGRLNVGKPIEPLYTVGELQSSYTHIDTLKETINNHFYLDRLLDFNNETRMTLGEAQLRNALRGQSLGAFYARQENEVITPMIERTFNILLKRGRLGVLSGSQEEIEQLKRGAQPVYIPEALAQRMINGEDFYEITYLSPAKRTMQSEELRGIIETANFAVQVAPASPEIIDNIDFDKLIARVAKLSGAPMELIKDSDTVKKIRDARAKQQEEIAKMEQARQQSEIGRNVAQMNAMQKQEVA